MNIKEKTCLDAWKKSIKYILDSGIDFVDSDNRECREVLNLFVTIEDPSSDVDMPIERMKDFEWIYPSIEELSSIIFNKDEQNVYEYSYGPRIFNFQGKKDQINDFIIPLLKKDPTSRRAIISLFNPATDAEILNKNIPSLLFVSFKIQDNKLNVTCYIRSNDFFIGWPGNIYQIHLLQKYVSEKLNIKTGFLSTASSSAHIFKEHLEHINKII